MWHPASLLLTWLGFAMVLQWVSLPWLLSLALASLGFSLVGAFERSSNLIGRSRWLLLSLLVLFLFVTPGEFLPGVWGSLGLTYEGLRLGGEQLARLLAMLSSLALLHQHLGTQGLLAGFHWLLAPFPWRRATVVRLLLVLEFVEQKRTPGWREWLSPEGDQAFTSNGFVLPMAPLRARDRLLMGGLIAVLLVGMFHS
jgi:energy-coupling factor transport system permease protein